MSTQTRILVADDDPLLCMLLRDTLCQAGFEVLVAHNGDELVRMAQEQAPHLLLIDLMMPVMDGYEAIRQLRNDTRTAHLPMIILTARSASADVVTGFETGADDYIVKPYDVDVLLARIRGLLRRASQRPVNNPLTGLPGNIRLQSEIERRLSQNLGFSLFYVDLDNFKAFNDAYGFSRGDRAIHLLAEVLTEIASEADFLGHIGGDDFALIHADADVEALCQSLIAAFDARVATLYDEPDLRRGYLQGYDRQGMPRHFGLLSVSIAVVSTHWREFQSAEDIGQVAAELKAQAKLIPGSSYVIDRRRMSKRPQSDDRRGQAYPIALLICADPELSVALESMLRSYGYRVLLATDMVAAHTLLARDPNMALCIADRIREPVLSALWQHYETPPPVLVIVTDKIAADSARSAGAYATVFYTPNTSHVIDQVVLHLSNLPE